MKWGLLLALMLVLAGPRLAIADTTNENSDNFGAVIDENPDLAIPSEEGATTESNFDSELRFGFQWVCVATTQRGERFRGRDSDRGDAARTALQKCERQSFHGWPGRRDGGYGRDGRDGGFDRDSRDHDDSRDFHRHPYWNTCRVNHCRMTFGFN